ncbi:MAG: endonuclease III [Thermoanaerobaculia bacterium]|nr:endonuclease III [Thermoanaerobaculia bacterium]
MAATSSRPMTPGLAARESKRERRERTAEILTRLGEEYPDSDCALEHRDAFELLVATILSAQCTDERVNQVTPALFDRFPTAADLAGAALGELEELIRSTGFYRNKARALKGLGQALEKDHDGEVPRTMEELIQLPGVGRKTANVVLGNAFGIEAGIVVDTHVGRLSRRLGLTAEKNAVEVEDDLVELVPEGVWTLWAHLLIDHGRAVCRARQPQCPECVLADLCPSAEI